MTNTTDNRRPGSGRPLKPNSRYADFELNAYSYSSSWTPAKAKSHKGMRELREIQFLKLDVSSVEAAQAEVEIAVFGPDIEAALVGATGESFTKTQDLSVMKYDEAMKDP